MKDVSSQANKVAEILDKFYEKSVNGYSKMKSAKDLASSYSDKKLTQNAAIDSLIKWQVSKTATSGFVTSLGGFATMPITLPSNIAILLFQQMRMTAAIAHIRGYDINDPGTKSLVYLTLTGNKMSGIVNDLGLDIEIIKKSAIKATKDVAKKVLTDEVIEKITKLIARKVSERIAVKSSKYIVKLVPVAGGIVGGTFDSVQTLAVAKKAKEVFSQPEIDNSDNTATRESSKVDDAIDLETNKLNIYINLIKADGRIDRKEMELFDDAIQNSLLDDSSKDLLYKNIMNDSFIPVNYEFIKKHPASIPGILYDLLDLAKVDGTIHDKEIEYIREVAHKLDVGDAFINDLLDI